MIWYPILLIFILPKVYGEWLTYDDAINNLLKLIHYKIITFNNEYFLTRGKKP